MLLVFGILVFVGLHMTWFHWSKRFSLNYSLNLIWIQESWNKDNKCLNYKRNILVLNKNNSKCKHLISTKMYWIFLYYSDLDPTLHCVETWVDVMLGICEDSRFHLPVIPLSHCISDIGIWYQSEGGMVYLSALPATVHILTGLNTMVNWYLWINHHLACVSGGKVLSRRVDKAPHVARVVSLSRDSTWNV